MTKIIIYVLLLSVFIPTLFANQAVSTINAQIGGIYGRIDGITSKTVIGNIAIPVGPVCGIQFDGLKGKIHTGNAQGMGLHAFWRDYQTGLMGLAISKAELDNVKATKIGVEVEIYRAESTLGFYGGCQYGDIDSSGYGSLMAGYYPHKNLMLGIEANISDSISRYSFGFEYQYTNQNISLYGNITGGENKYDHIFLGLKINFGPTKKTLIRHHREDDSINPLISHIINIYSRH